MNFTIILDLLQYLIQERNKAVCKYNGSVPCCLVVLALSTKGRN